MISDARIRRLKEMAKLREDSERLARQCADALLHPERLGEAMHYAQQRAATLIRLAMMKEDR